MQARRLGEGSEKSNLQSLPELFDAIDAGLGLRRQLDALGPDERIASSRRSVVTELLVLQQRAVGKLGGMAPTTPRSQQVASRVKGWLAETRNAVRTVLAGVRLGPLHQALAIEGLRTDLEWFSVLVARIDQETPHPVATWLDVELDRLRSWLGTAVASERDPRDEPVRAGCERLQAVLLERRIERELARTPVGMSADGLWAERFHLSRLQTQVETLVLSQAANRPGERISKSTGPEPGLPVFAASPINRLAALERRRTQLADDAFDRISALDLASRDESCERIVRTAADEVGETLAFLEDMPLRRAVTRLKLMREDLERLAISCRHCATSKKRARDLKHRRHSA